MSDVEDTAGETTGTVMDRRALLRAGGVVAGIAGIGAYAGANAPSAGAAAGAPVLMGATNNAGTASTALTAATAGPTLVLANTATNGVPLRLAEHAVPPSEVGVSGDLTNIRGDLRYTHSSDYAPASVYTELTASQLIPVPPFRVVDTRTSWGRRYIQTGDDSFDSSGRLLGGHPVLISLQEEVLGGTAVYANLTVTQPVSSGFLTLWPGGTRPGTSSLNYSAGQTVANFCVSGLYRDKVRLYAKSTTHVVLDVVAFVVYSSSDINDAVLPEPDPSGLAGASHTPPAWWTSQNR